MKLDQNSMLFHTALLNLAAHDSNTLKLMYPKPGVGLLVLPPYAPRELKVCHDQGAAARGRAGASDSWLRATVRQSNLTVLGTTAGERHAF